MRAAIYARYSSDQQREASIDDQIRLCKEKIAKEGWTLIQVFRDSAMSGATTLRPGYQAMLEAAREAGFDVVVAEALDRLSRDQEDVAALFKRLQFAGIKLVTLGEGEIGALHIGRKGTMNALFLKDLADKVRRGLRGRIEDGKSGGVTAPRGGAWSASTLNANRSRGTGVLNNEIYIGRLVWNRLRYAKDPETGRRRSRANENEAVITTDASELAIVSQEVWDAVKAPQAALGNRNEQKKESKGGAADGAPAPFWSKQRPRYLFSGLMRCGGCGGGFSKISAAHFGCSTARNKGESVCANRLTIRRDILEATVMDGLRHRLMDPGLFRTFAQEFTAEWNRLQADAGAELDQLRAEHERVDRRIERLVDASAEGAAVARVTQKLRELERRRLDLEAELSTAAAPAPRLHPHLAEVYRRKVEDLHLALAQDDAGPARELVRGLVEAIVLIPEGGRLRVEVRGELAAILRLSGTGKEKAPAGGPELLVGQIKMVAGTGFEPVTFRL